MGMVFMMVLMLLPVQTIQASVWNNAYTYYNTYGNSVIFRPTSTTDGNIYYATKAATATSSIRYRTIGWKVTVKNLSGTTLQTIYFKLGGSYMNRVDVRKKSGYEYDLYSLSLYNLKRRLNTKAGNAMAIGEADIILDACMIIVNNGKEMGAMSDSGPTSGTVYTTKSGISGAANWSSSAKQSFSSYFNKIVEGLFFKVSAKGDEGISGISGEGYYCYGSYVTLKAKVKKGYNFEMWEGDVRSAHTEISFYVSEEEWLVARTEKVSVTIVFHRNYSEDDTVVAQQTLRYGDNKYTFDETGWRKDGKEMLGWAFSQSAGNPDYAARKTVKNAWVLKYAPQVHLYAVWESTDHSGASTQIPNPVAPGPTVTPDPSVPDPTVTPDPVTPEPTVPTPDPVIPTPDQGEGLQRREIRCRFISSKYFEDEAQNLIPSEKGGLAPDSRWALDPFLRQLLRCVLQGTSHP